MVLTDSARPWNLSNCHGIIRAGPVEACQLLNGEGDIDTNIASKSTIMR